MILEMWNRSLLAAMEHAGKIDSGDNLDDQETEYGIGTPATRAATIEKMIEKEMVVRKGRALFPTEYGIKLVEILPEELQSPEMTGEWEAKLAKIGNGDYSSDVFMEDIRKYTQEVVRFATIKGDTGIKDSLFVGKCPVCGNNVREYETSYYCTNKECSFRGIYKAVKGYHPTLKSITMRELLANKTATTDKGIYKLIEKEPFIIFERAPKPVPDYGKLKGLMEDYGVSSVDNVGNGGGLWIDGDSKDELIKDFVRDSVNIGCQFDFYQDSKALGHHSGWCHRVGPEYRDSYLKTFEIKDTAPASSKKQIASGNDGDPVLKIIKESGFEFVDKRGNGGCLWIIVGETEGKPLIDKCAAAGMRFTFSSKGGKASTTFDN